MNSLKNNLPKGWLMTVIDFSENYRCGHQDEIASAYYNYSQVTIVPIVSYYQCQDCDETVQHSSVFITPDLKHDAHAAEAALNQMLDQLSTTGVVPYHHILCSDGCSSQFKSKVPFFFTQLGRERVYFGSRHGKNVCDGLGRTIKRSAERYVKARRGQIRDAKEFYQFCEDQLTQNNQTLGKCIHKKRTFTYSEDIDRPKVPDLVTVPGTTKFHHIKSVGPNLIQARQFACFCPPCRSEVGECESSLINTEWLQTPQDMLKKKGQKRKKKAKVVSKPKRVPLTMSSMHLASPRDTSIVALQRSIDQPSLDLMPTDLPPGLYPVCVTADGNCLTRAASLCQFGTEDKYPELKSCMASELKKNKQYYQATYGKYAIYSDQFKSGMDLQSKKDQDRIYAGEIRAAEKDGAYLGMTHVGALSSVLERSIFSVYPQYGGSSVRQDYHRIIHPRNKSSEDILYIMWTNTAWKKVMPRAMWCPNHFVPLLRLYKNIPVESNSNEVLCGDAIEKSSVEVLELDHVIDTVIANLDADLDIDNTSFIAK